MVISEGEHVWAVKPGERIYAIGDVHGRADLVEAILALIRDDNAGRPPARTKIVFLGDIVDRGPHSADVVRRLMRYASSRHFIVLKGNHEAVMCAALAGELQALKGWLRVGGAETLRSYGVGADLIAQAAPSELVGVARASVGRVETAWLNGLPLLHRSGDMVFVHAGVRPNIALSRQDADDLMWIGEDFLRYEPPHPFLVVHGHTVTEDGPDVRANRIGVDTGAYRTGRLTALGLERTAWWTFST